MSTYPGDDPNRPEDPSSDQQGEEPGAQPGEEPGAQPGEEPADQPGEEPADQPGYWEQQAAEQAREQTQQGHPEHTAPITPSGPSFDPTTAPSTRPYEQGYGEQAYGEPRYPDAQQPPDPYAQQGWSQPQGPQQAQYGQPYHGQPPYGQPSYGQPYHGQPYQQGSQPAYQQPYQQPGTPGAYPAFAPVPPNHPQSTTAMVLGLVGLVGAFFFCGLTLVASPFAWTLGRNALKEIGASQGRLGGESSARAGMIMGIIGTVLLVLGLLMIIGFAVVVAIGAAGSSV